MATATVSDAKQTQLLNTLGLTGSVSLADLEWQFYSANSGLSPANKYSITDHKLAFYKLQGALGGSLADVERSYFSLIGAQGATYDDLAFDFYKNYGYGPGSISGLAAWYDASSISSTVIAKDTFDRSKNLLATLDPSYTTGITVGGSGGGLTAVSMNGIATNDTSVRDTVVGHTDTNSFKVTKGASSTDFTNCGYLSITFPQAGTYIVSVWVKTSSEAGVLRLSDDGSFTGATITQVTVASGYSTSWVRITNTVVVTNDLSGVFVVRTQNNMAAAATINIDDWQVELGSQATPFVWGDATHLGVSDSGHVWTVLGGTWGISSGTAIETVSTSCASVIDTGSPDIDLTVDVTPSAINATGIALRVVDLNNYIRVDLYPGGPAVRCLQVVGGSSVSSPASTVPIVAGQKYTLRVVLVSNSLDIYLNGVFVFNTPIAASEMTATSTVTKHGLYTDSTGVWDNLVVKTPIYSDGAALPIWPDISGNYRHATQAVSGKRPLFRKNNKNVLSFPVATCEIDLVGWTSNNETLSLDNTQLHSGTRSIKAVSTGTVGGSFQANGAGVLAPITPNQPWMGSAYILISAASPPASVTLNLQWFDVNKNYIAGVAGDFTSVTGAWQRLTSTGVAPANAAYANVAISMNGPTVTGTSTVWLDDQQIETGNAATTWFPPVTLPSTGKPCVQFNDGATTSLDNISGFLAGSPGGSIFVVRKIERLTGTPMTMAGQELVMKLSIAPATSTNFLASNNGTSWTSNIGFTVPLPDTSWHLHNGDTTSAIYFDGVQEQAGGVVTPLGANANAFSIGSYAGGSEPILGEIAAVLVFNRALSTNERQRVERYLKARYGTP